MKSAIEARWRLCYPRRREDRRTRRRKENEKHTSAGQTGYWAHHGRAKYGNADSLICASVILRHAIRPAHHPAVGQDQKLDTVMLNSSANNTPKILVHSLRRCHPNIFKELRVTRCQYRFEPFRSI